MELTTRRCPTCGRDVASRLKQCPACATRDKSARPDGPSAKRDPVITATVDALPGRRISRIMEILSAVGAAPLPAVDLAQTSVDEQLRLHASAAAKARRSALQGLKDAAARHGANAVLGVRFEQHQMVLGQPLVVVTAHGTPCVAESQSAARTAPGSGGAALSNGLRTAAAAATVWHALDGDW